MNVKLKRVKLKYGYLGWGIYWHVVELIASELDPPRKQDCVFEGDSFILADSFTNDETIKEILDYFVEIGLFTKNEKNEYVNLKLLERLDETTKRKTRKNYNKSDNPDQDAHHDGTIRNNPEQSGQSKVKESKVKESKVKESKVNVVASKTDAPKGLTDKAKTSHLKSVNKNIKIAATPPGAGLDNNLSKSNYKNTKIPISTSSSEPRVLTVAELIKEKD